MTLRGDVHSKELDDQKDFKSIAFIPSGGYLSNRFQNYLV